MSTKRMEDGPRLTTWATTLCCGLRSRKSDVSLQEFLPGGLLTPLAGQVGTQRCSPEAGHDVVAVDASDAMLDRARARGIVAEFHRGDVQAIPVPDGTFDVAVCALALTHVPDLAPAISELGRVVRPGGRVIISDMHPVATATGAHAFFFAGD